VGAGTGKQIGEPLAGHTGSVSSAEFSPDGTSWLNFCGLKALDEPVLPP